MSRTLTRDGAFGHLWITLRVPLRGFGFLGFRVRVKGSFKLRP